MPQKGSQEIERSRSFVISFRARDVLFFGVLIFLNLLFLRIVAQPSFGQATYQYAGFERRTADHPVFVPSQAEALTIDIPMQLAWLHPSTFYIKPDDCLEELTINGKAVQEERIRFCDFSTLGQPFDLSAYLIPGTNTLSFKLKDSGGNGGVRITPSRTDPLISMLNWSVTLFGMGLFMIFAIAITKDNQLRFLLLIFSVGTALRVLYLLSTHYFVRGHDTDDHIRYIRYVAENFSMPPASEGFVFHHPPLYYFFGALVVRLDYLLGRMHEATVLHDLQIFSLLLSIGALAIATWIARKLFRSAPYQGFFLAIIATMPTLIFDAARITNNTLYVLLSFLAFGLLVQWWQTRNLRTWYCLIAAASLACVTRVSGLVFMPVIFGLMPFVTQTRWWKRIAHWFTGLLLFVALTGWFPLVRFLIEQNHQNMFTLGNKSMHSGLRLTTTFEHLVTFNPFAFLAVPFNHPWEDAARRQFFLEYFFRSAFFGEFQYPKEFVGIASTLLFFGTLTLLFLVIGFWRRGVLDWRKSAPFMLLFLLMFAAQVAYRVFAPFSANQDFRHSVPFLLPLAFFLVAGLEHSPKYLAPLGRYALTMLVSLCAAFILLLYFFEF